MKTARPDRIGSFSFVCPNNMESTGQMSCRVLSWPTDNADFRKVIKRMDVEASVSSCPQNVTATQRISTPGGTGDFLPLDLTCKEGAGGRRWSDYLSLPTCRLGWNIAEGTLQLGPSVNTRHRVHSLTHSRSFHFNFRNATISIHF